MTAYWNGEPAAVRHLQVRMPTNGPDNAWWTGPMPDALRERFASGFAALGLDPSRLGEGHIDLRGQVVDAIEVVDAWGSTHLLYDGDGSGWVKVTEGRGSPRLGHRSVPSEAVEVRP